MGLSDVRDKVPLEAFKLLNDHNCLNDSGKDCYISRLEMERKK